MELTTKLLLLLEGNLAWRHMAECKMTCFPLSYVAGFPKNLSPFFLLAGVLRIATKTIFVRLCSFNLVYDF